MAFSSGFAIFLVPVLFVVVERMSRRLSGNLPPPASSAANPSPANQSGSESERAAGGG